MTVLNSSKSKFQHLSGLTDQQIADRIRLLTIEVEVEKRLTEGKSESRSSMEFLSGLIFYFIGFFVLISSLVFLSGLYFFGLITAFLIYGSLFILTGLYLLFFKPKWFGNGLHYWYRQFKGESES